MKRKITMSLMLLLTMSVLLAVPVSAQTVPVVQDNGSGNQYGALAKNCVQILNMNVGSASVSSGGNYTVEYRHIGQSDQWGLIYNGSMNFGSANATNSSAAKMADNHLPDVTLRWNGGARLPDGTLCDIVLDLSEIHVYCGKSSVSTSQTFKTVIMNSWSFRTQPPRTAAWKSSKACTGTYMKATMTIMDRGTNNAVSAEDYPTMLMLFKDLDIRDKTMKKSAGDTAKGNGTFAEGIAMDSGWTGSAVIAPDTSDIANTRLVDSDTWNGRTRIKVDGPKQVEFQKKTGSEALGDDNSLWSGFIAAARPQGFSWYWMASSPGGSTIGIATAMGGQPTVAVLAMREGPGAAASYLGSPGGGTSGVNSWHTNTHVMNSSATYTATPGTGMFLESMKVDGAAQTISEEEKTAGKPYTFEKLNKYPLPQRVIRNGQVLAAYDSGHYTVQAAFRHYPKYTAKKDADRVSVRLGSDDEIRYQIVCEEIYSDAPAGDHALHDDLAGGILKVDPDTIDVTCEYGSATVTPNDEDSDGYADSIDVLFESEDAGSGLPKMVLTYTATVDWDRYAASEDSDITNAAAGCNKPEAGGDRTGNETSVRVTTDIRVTKTVTGKLRDETKKFEFDVALRGLVPGGAYVFTSVNGGDLDTVVSGTSTGNGFRATSDGEAVLSCRLTGRQGFIIKDLPVGATYQVTEGRTAHVASYKLSSDSASAVFAGDQAENAAGNRELATAEETVDKQDGTVTVAYINRRDAATVTGIIADCGWLIAAAALLIAGTAAVAAKGKTAKERKEAADGQEQV